MQPKRMHPMKIIFTFSKTVRNSFVIILYLFVVRFNDVSTFMMMARFLFLAFLIYRLGSITVEWWRTTYTFQDGSIQIYSGVLERKESRVPLDQVQNVKRNTPFYYRIFHLTALSLQTSATNKEASVVFEAVKQREAERIEQLVLSKRRTEEVEEERETVTDSKALEMDQSHKEKHHSETETIHFRPTRRDLWKASLPKDKF